MEQDKNFFPFRVTIFSVTAIQCDRGRATPLTLRMLSDQDQALGLTLVTADTPDDATFSRPSNGLLLDLELFLKKEGATHRVMLSWWSTLTGLSSNLVAFRRMIKKTIVSL